jgi:hypothetical protein
VIKGNWMHTRPGAGRRKRGSLQGSSKRGGQPPSNKI